MKIRLFWPLICQEILSGIKKDNAHERDDFILDDDADENAGGEMKWSRITNLRKRDGVVHEHIILVCL